MKNIILFIITLVILIAFSNICKAEYPNPWDAIEDEETAGKEMDFDRDVASSEMQGTIEGKVVRVSGTLNAVWVEGKVIGGETSLAPYYAVHETSFIEITSLEDLNTDDYVEIDYYLAKEKNIIDTIVLKERAHEAIASGQE